MGVESGSEDVYGMVARMLVKARHVIAFTGAGISTPSGIPDFRGPQGLWRRINPEVFGITYFLTDPMPAWRAFLELYKTTVTVRPNPAHYALAVLEGLGVVRAVITQNVDGLHQKAGSKKVIELHGNPSSAVCVVCGRRYPLDYALRQVERGEVPRCPECGGLLKPDVVFFGEPLPERALAEAIELAYRSDLVLVAGSSLVVRPANEIPWIVKRRGGKLVIVNLGETLMDHLADVKIEEDVSTALPRICEATLRLLKRDPRACWGPDG